MEAGRQAYVLCIDGTSIFTQRQSASDNEACTDTGIVLERHDASEIVGPTHLTVTGPSHLLVVEMAFDPRAHGRTDNRQ